MTYKHKLDVFANFTYMHMQGLSENDTLDFLNGSTEGIFIPLLNECQNDFYVALGKLYLQTISENTLPNEILINDSLLKKILEKQNLVKACKVFSSELNSSIT